jgi:salicylate hydroxylase
MWPRIQFHELGDQPWLPSWLHHHEQFSLSQLWNLHVPFWSRGSLASHACAVLREQLSDLSAYTIVDVCAGAGGPTPLIEAELNKTTNGHGQTRFVLTDMYPPVDVWTGIAKKQPSIEFVERPVDARALKRVSDEKGKECRIFNICFHHFDDDDARGILRSAMREADAFMYVHLFYT